MTPLIGSLCTGYGGLDMAVQAVFGGEVAWWSDIEPGPIAVSSRHHPCAPNIGDLTAVDWSAVQRVNILTAGYPCQPFSNAGKRLGTDDPRHIWPHIARGIGVLRPRVVVLENVAAHLRRGFDVVIGDLAARGYDARGYDARWQIVRASDVGAPHRRERLYVVATDTLRQLGNGSGTQEPGRVEPTDSSLPTTDTQSIERWGDYTAAIERWGDILGRPAPEPTQSGVRAASVLSAKLVEWMMGLPEGHVTDTPGLTRNQQIKILGNGVVPQQAELALRMLTDNEGRW